MKTYDHSSNLRERACETAYPLTIEIENNNKSKFYASQSECEKSNVDELYVPLMASAEAAILRSMRRDIRGEHTCNDPRRRRK